MKKTILASLLFSVAIPTLTAAGIEKGSSWTDGFTAVTVTEVKGHISTFMGGTLHEGGTEFQLFRLPSGEYSVAATERDADNDFCYFGGNTQNGDKVVLSKVDGIEVLASYDANGNMKHMYQRFDGDLDRFEINDMMTVIAGDYVDSKGGVWKFTTDQKLAMPGTTLQQYTIMYTYEIPENIFKLANGKFIQVEESTTGVNIYNCQFDEQEEYGTKGKLIAKLRKTNTPWGKKGLCPYTSTRLINCTMLSGYDRNMLRIIRNEIWARHGYMFSSADLKKHFTNQSWYLPSSQGNSSIRLTPVEQMNVEIIKAAENSLDNDQKKTEAGL